MTKKEIIKIRKTIFDDKGYTDRNNPHLDIIFKEAFLIGMEQVKKLNIDDVSKSVAKQYAEFCVRCDREGLPLLELDDYIKEYCC